MTQKDPRVSLPSPWRHGYGPGNVFSDVEANDPKHLRRQWFDNPKARQRTWADPRLTPEALSHRGVDVREFVLI
jgi:hypothetical protein